MLRAAAALSQLASEQLRVTNALSKLATDLLAAAGRESDPRLYKVSEVADRLGQSITTVREEIAAGALRITHNVSPHRGQRISHAELTRYLATKQEVEVAA